MAGAWERNLEARRRKQAIDAAAKRYAMQTELRDWREYVPEPEPVVFERPSRFSIPTGTPLITPSGETPTTEDYEVAGQFAMDALFGPERQSVLPGDQQASLPERFVRDWGLSEQEFRTAGQRASEGRFGAAAGWGLLGLAGAIPFVGDVGRLAGAAGDVARGAERAADVGRAPRITLRADDVERVQGIGNEYWFRVPDPDNPRARMTLPGSSGGGRLGGRPMTLDEVPDEIYHVTTNASGIRADGMINVSRGGNMGAGGTSGSGAVSLSASRESAETLASDLRAYAELKALTTEDEVIDFLLGISRRDGMTQEGLSSLEEYLRRAAASSKGRESFVPEKHSKGIYDAWQFARGSRGGPNASIIIGNPFGDYWRTVRPEDINIIPVNKRQIPESALINDYDVGRGALDEIQVYADIPLSRAVERAADVASSGRGFASVVRPVNEADEVLSGIADQDQILSRLNEQPFIGSQGPDGTSRFISSTGEFPPSSKEAFIEHVRLSIGDRINDPEVARIIDEASDQLIVVQGDFTDAARAIVANAEDVDEAFWPSSEIATDVDNPALISEIAAAMSDRAERLADAHNEIVLSNASDMIASLGPDYPRFYGNHYGVTTEDMAQSLRSIAPNLRPTVAVTRSALMDILAEGGFLSQYAVGDSNGLYDPMFRFLEETRVIGTDPASIDRPIYGYLGTHERPNGLDFSTNNLLENGYSVVFGTAANYGDINIVFDRSVLDRSTFTLGDSLGADFYAMPANRLRDITSLDVRLSGGFNVSSANVPSHVDYIELQITNPTLEDIREIVVDLDRSDLNADGSLTLELSAILFEAGSAIERATGKPTNITLRYPSREGTLLRKYDYNAGKVVFG